MKKNILYLFFLIFTVSVQAQTLEPGEDIYVEHFQVDLTDNWSEPIVHGKVTNLTNAPIQLKWELEVPVDGPDEWEYRICDNNQCYSTNVVSNINPMGGGPNVPVDIAAGDTTLLDFHILPRLVAGNCKAKIHLSLVNDPTNILATAEFDVTIEGLTSTTEAEKASVKLFPNPTSDFFRLSQNEVVETMVIYNIIGRPIRTFSAQNGNNYDISDLPNGLYLVSMIDADNDIIKTIRLSKTSLRP